MDNTPKQSFFKRNLVAIVMIPFVICAHIGWQRMQYVEELVPAHERKIVNVAVEAPKKVIGRVLHTIFPSDETEKPEKK
ncbi:uncharacterized protein LOC134833773 [Culicoides brevitarsis]|uniref:uncharacterized protein LOC134833773 n=1 Tax=Culicoides brevitarsis TaxID=469753 RepID=UPI00307BB820